MRTPSGRCWESRGASKLSTTLRWVGLVWMPKVCVASVWLSTQMCLKTVTWNTKYVVVCVQVHYIMYTCEFRWLLKYSLFSLSRTLYKCTCRSTSCPHKCWQLLPKMSLLQVITCCSVFNMLSTWTVCSPQMPAHNTNMGTYSMYTATLYHKSRNFRVKKYFVW